MELPKHWTITVTIRDATNTKAVEVTGTNPHDVILRAITEAITLEEERTRRWRQHRLG